MVRRRLDAGAPAQTEAMRLSSPSRSKQSRWAAVMKLAVVSGLVGSGLAAMAGSAGADAVSGGLVLVSTSADGRYVAFASMATNLVPGDQDMVVDVFVKDLATGNVELVSQTADGLKGNAISERPSISADGQRVAFDSAADNLSPDDTDGYPDVLVKDLRTGKLTVATSTADGTKAAGGGSAASLSADGSAVAFASKATNLSSDTPDGRSHVYVKNLDSGLLTVADGGTIDRPDQQFGANDPALSADGQVVAFATDAGGLDPVDTDQRSDVYVRDLQTSQLRLASVNGDGAKGDSPSGNPSLSGDGTLVAFETASANLDPGDTDQSSDVYVKNLKDGSLRLGSTDIAGVKANQSVGYPSLSRDGSYLAFSTDATNLGIDTPPLVKQIYRKNLDSGELEPVSVTADGIPGDYLSIDPSIAGDGSVVAFYSPSTNLVADGGNRAADVMAKVLSASIPPSPSDVVSPTATLHAWPSTMPANRGTKPVRLTGSAADEGGIATVT